MTTERDDVLGLLNDAAAGCDAHQMRTRIVQLGGAEWCRDFRIDPTLFPSLSMTGTLLHETFHYGSTILMRELIKGGVPVNATDDDGATVLHHACGQSSRGVDFYTSRSAYDRVIDVKTRMLVTAGADLEATDRLGNTPLIRAAIGGKSVPDTVILTLLELGCNPKAKDTQGWSVLHYAARSREEEVLQKMLDMGLDVDHQSMSGDTALHVSQIETLPILLRHGANMSLRNSNGHDVPGLLDAFMADGNAYHTEIAMGMMEIWNAEILHRWPRWQAFLMGLDERLGAASRVRSLDPGVVHIIISFTGRMNDAD